MVAVKFRCLACGHLFEDRVEQPRNRRQCAKCGRRRSVDLASYKAAVKQARKMRHDGFLPDVTRTAFASLLDALNPVSPQSTISSVLQGRLDEALNDPFIAVKAALDVWRDACRGEDESI